MARWTIAGVFTSLLLSGCLAGGYYDPGYSYPASSEASPPSSATTAPESKERSYVDRNGNIVFRKPGETTIVEPDGDVKIIQRDPDGTRTTVDSDGNVKVDPPGRGGRGRNDDD